MRGKLRFLFAAVLMAAVATVGAGRFVSTPDKAEAAAAYNINVVAQSCTGNGFVQINLAWAPPGEGASWIDLSLQNNGFAPGTFLGIGPFGAYDAQGVWAGLQPGLLHFLRINTLTPFGWTPSQTISFMTRGDCGSAIAYQPPVLLFRPTVLSQVCLPNGQVEVTFNWSLIPTAGYNPFYPNVMFADVSMGSSFIPGTFIGYGQVTAAPSTLVWDGFVPGRLHFFRLNGYGPNGWMPSLPISFTTISC